MKDYVDPTNGTDIITLPEKADLPAYFLREGGIEELVTKIEAEVDRVEHDYSTAKGRKSSRSYASKVSSSKTLLETVRKEITADWREKTAKVNAAGKIAVERLDALRDRIRAPADAFEKKEADRQAAHMRAMDQFGLEELSAHSGVAELKAKIEAIEAVEIGTSWEEFEGEAREAKAAALTKYRSDLGIAEQREAADRELEELRREKAEREAREAEEKAAKEREAQEKAAAEETERQQREASERAVQEAKEAAAREVQAAKEAQERAEREAEERAEAAAKAERLRFAREQQAAAEAEAKRKADTAHRLKIRTEIVQSFTNMEPDGWETTVDAMIDGKIPHVKVSL
ncbi:hypothetical protein [Leisingera sp. M523]|uniref:hypothetical protein n=1 Tax=Leisingera sp. M523 TaxID=2867013 RepID=UPI0021A94E5F|nr:hypothetical protein [Leisingera sp. M523]UWQ30220.1 hypothetical protein K3557_06705 [Leisingera sp. M523]